jgi:hypothetical protein
MMAAKRVAEGLNSMASFAYEIAPVKNKVTNRRDSLNN